MGIAQYNNGVFRLVASCRHDADAARLDEWRAAFQHASQMLFDATLGQQRFGEILVANRSMGGTEADLWLMEPPGPSASSHGFAQPGEHSTLQGDERFRPFVILHEFAHYAYDVFDEYTTPDGLPAACIGDPAANACIMESGWIDGDRFGPGGNGGTLEVGRVQHFCVASNHDPDHDTRQDVRRRRSCWESMVARFPDLVMPGRPPATGTAGRVPNIRWTLLAPEQRYVLVADRSRSMAGAKLREAQSGCHWWVDNATLGDLLGVVSFSSSASVDQPLQALVVDAGRAAHHGAIDAWVAAGNTAIGGALRTALDEILGLGQRAATQVAILLTDGLQNRGEAVERVRPDLASAGVRVYTIGVGPTIDEALLNGVATDTGGRFVRIDPGLAEEDQSLAIRTALEELSFEVRDNGGVVTSSERAVQPGQATRARIMIEEGSTRATFLVSRRAQEKLALRLIDPTGAVFTLNSVARGVRAIQSARAQLAIQVSSPQPGPWRVEVSLSKSSQQPAAFRLIVGSENPDLGTALYANATVYEPGDEVRLHLRVFAPLPVTGLRIRAAVRGQQLAKAKVAFRDDGRGGDEIAGDGVYTGVLRAPAVPGTYHVRAVVQGAAGAVRASEPDDHGDRRRRNRQVKVPAFARVLETAFVVAKP